MFLLLGAARAQSETRCPLREVKFATSNQETPISVSNVSFATRFEQSVSWLDVKNDSSKPIGAVSLIVEFYTGKDYVLSLLFHAATLAKASGMYESTPRFSSIFTTPQTLPASLLPGESKRLEESGPLFAMHCPNTARVSFVRIDFGSGATFEVRANGWRCDAWLSNAKPWPLDGIPQQPTFGA